LSSERGTPTQVSGTNMLINPVATVEVVHTSWSIFETISKFVKDPATPLKY
jgi:hypothetical protein